MSTKSILFVHEPDWIQHRQGVQHCLPGNIQSWIYEGGSLTRRLRNFYGDSVKVNILFHHWCLPFLSERRLLKLPEHRFCLTREVVLQANGVPLILARTIIPEQTIKGAHRNLSHLGNRPLGEVIFSYPKLERLEMHIAWIEPDAWQQNTRDSTKISSRIWGRRTVYAIAHREMLVSEFFLSGVLNG